MRHGEGQRGRGVSTGSPRSTWSPKQVILGLFGRNRPRDHVSMFSDSQVPRPRHPPASRSFSNDSAMTLGETGPQLPTWGGAERPGLLREWTQSGPATQTLRFFYFELFKLYFHDISSLVLCKLK